MMKLPPPEAVPLDVGEPAPTAKPRTGGNILPDPIPGYDPLDPSNPYPHREPVENFYPPEFDLEDLNGIILMSQDSILDSMWDNSILRALAYTGFNVQKLKDNNWLYKYEYISSRLLSRDSSILSDIGYGEYPNGDEPVSDGSTPTGKAPNIPNFESNRLVCAFFVNYLRSRLPPSRSQRPHLQNALSDALSRGLIHSQSDVLIEFSRLTATPNQWHPGSTLIRNTTFPTLSLRMGQYHDDFHAPTSLIKITDSQTIYGTGGTQRGYSGCNMYITYATTRHRDTPVFYGE